MKNKYNNSFVLQALYSTGSWPALPSPTYVKCLQSEDKDKDHINKVVIKRSIIHNFKIKMAI